MAYYDHFAAAEREKQLKKYLELKEYIGSIDKDGNKSEWFPAYIHLSGLESELEKTKKRIEEYQKFFSLLNKFLLIYQVKIMKILHLILKKKWFQMILSGEKREEYREVKPYWEKRLDNGVVYDIIEFRNGYAKNAPTIVIHCLGIYTGLAKPEWSDNWKGNVFIIKLGSIIETKNC